MTTYSNPTHSQHSATRINSLDGLRGLAILLVVLFHTYSWWSKHIPWASIYKEFYLFKFGFLGVQLFFLISGFVIYMTLEKCTSLSQFMLRRWLRLFPAMLIGTVLIYLTSFYLIERPKGQIDFIDLLPGLLFIDHNIMNAVQNFTDIDAIEGAFWSLFVEIKFYLMFGALYFYNKKTALRNLIVIFLSAFAYVVAGKLIPSLSQPIIDKILFNMLSLQYFGWFCIGALLYKAQVEKNMQLVFLSALMMFPTIFVKYGRDFALITACTVVYLTFYLTLNTRIVSSFFASRFFLFWGFISYPLYLIHENAMVAMTIKTYHSAPYLPDLVTPLPGIALIVLASYLMAKYLEPATRGILKKQMDNLPLLTRLSRA